MRKARIIGTRMAVPDCVVDNHLLARCMNTSDEWIVQRTGIKERRVSPDTYRMLLRLAEARDKIAFMNEVFAQGLDGKIDSTLTVADLAFEASRMALKNAGVTIEQIDCLDALKIPLEKTYNNIDRYGNTAAASVPICVHEALLGGRIKVGDLILLAAFGTGFSWGASLLRW